MLVSDLTGMGWIGRWLSSVVECSRGIREALGSISIPICKIKNKNKIVIKIPYNKGSISQA